MRRPILMRARDRPSLDVRLRCRLRLGSLEGVKETSRFREPHFGPPRLLCSPRQLSKSTTSFCSAFLFLFLSQRGTIFRKRVDPNEAQKPRLV